MAPPDTSPGCDVGKIVDSCCRRGKPPIKRTERDVVLLAGAPGTVVRTPRWLLEVWGSAGSLRRAEAGAVGVAAAAEEVVVRLLWFFDDEDLAPDELRPLSMMAVANEADFFRASLLLSVWDCCSVSLPASASAPLPPFAVDADADADADTDAEDAVRLSPHPFLAARPRTSPASSVADFFLVFSSSDDRLDDMMVSRVL